ncbi:MAG: polysaccharide deacetylase family protein [Pyrinomonadaceae bacterium]
MNLNAVKRKTASIFEALGLNSLGHLVQCAALVPFIRVINYHDIPFGNSADFEKHLQYFASRFTGVDECILRNFLSSGDWSHTKPGIIISFDDAMRSHFDIAAPLLEKYGFTGWFFVPAGWIAERLGSNPEAAGNAGDQPTLTLEQVRYLDAKHVVGCHTETHCRLSDDLSDERLRFEILGAKTSLEEMLGHEVNIFCWVGGEEFTYSKRAADLVKKGYDLSFMTNTAVVRAGTNPLQLQRSNVEAENPLSLVKFQLSGLMDLLYTPKRRRVNKLTA